MAATTLAQLVERVAERWGGYRQGTATSGSTTTVVDTSALIEVDDYWIGHFMYVLTDAGGAAAAPQGEERAVTDFVQSTATLTVSPVLTAAVASGDTYELLPLRREVIKRAINAAIREAGTAWMIRKVDTSTITVADDDYDYTLPTDVVTLLSVRYRGDTDERWMDVKGWEVSKTPGAQELLLETLSGLDAGDTLRLEYLARPTALSTDAGTLGVGEPAERELVAFVEEYSLFWLHDRAASRGGEGFREHLTLAGDHYQRAMVKKNEARGEPGGQARTERWGRARG